MPKETPAQQRKVHKVMHEYKEGDLHSSTGNKVKSRKQAVAIALHEAGAAQDQQPAAKRKKSG